MEVMTINIILSILIIMLREVSLPESVTMVVTIQGVFSSSLFYMIKKNTNYKIHVFRDNKFLN